MKSNDFHTAAEGEGERRHGEILMKRFRLFPIALAMILAVSCIINTGGTGGSSSGLVTNPAKGLDKLSHYRADLSVSIKAQASGETIDQTEKISLAVWTAEKAVFQTVESSDEAGQPVNLTLGKVDKAGYLLIGGDTGCRTFWDDTNIRVGVENLAPYLYAVKSGTPAGDETVNGIAAHVYQVNADYPGVKDVKETGKVWIASSGGYLVKYHVELSGGEALFGAGATGTRTVDYELSDVDSGAPLAYPGDCLPVLTDIPATDDAQNVERMPFSLRYVSASSPDTVQAFYEKYFTGQGWSKLNDVALPDGEMDLLFSQGSTGREATVMLQSLDGGTAVNVLAAGGESSGTAPTPTGGTPEGDDSLPASVRIITSLSTLFGNEKTPSPLPSFTLATSESLPSASGTNTLTTLQAEVQGANVHYILTAGGKTTDAILFEGKEYQVVGGKAQPGSAMLSATWSLWQLDPLVVLSAAGMAGPKAEAGTTWEGRQVDVYSVDSASLGGEGTDSSFGMLPVVITAIQGTVWIDHATGALLKADLKFEAGVRKPGESTPSAHGKGEFHLAVSQIGKTTVSLP
jgi:hypothetical protein